MGRIRGVLDACGSLTLSIESTLSLEQAIQPGESLPLRLKRYFDGSVDMFAKDL